MQFGVKVFIECRGCQVFPLHAHICARVFLIFLFCLTAGGGAVKNKPYFIVTDMSGPSGLFLMPTKSILTEHLRTSIP